MFVNSFLAHPENTNRNTDGTRIRNARHTQGEQNRTRLICDSFAVFCSLRTRWPRDSVSRKLQHHVSVAVKMLELAQFDALVVVGFLQHSQKRFRGSSAGAVN